MWLLFGFDIRNLYLKGFKDFCHIINQFLWGSFVCVKLFEKIIYLSFSVYPVNFFKGFSSSMRHFFIAKVSKLILFTVCAYPFESICIVVVSFFPVFKPSFFVELRYFSFYQSEYLHRLKLNSHFFSPS